jgi:hypothetical protein
MTDNQNTRSSLDEEANRSDTEGGTSASEIINSAKKVDSEQLGQPQAKADAKSSEQREFPERNPGWVDREV